MILLHKILPLLVSPLFLLLAMMLYGSARRRWRWAWVAVAGLYLVSVPLVSGFLVRQAEGGQIRLAAPDMPRAEAIVVLSGMLFGVAGENGVVMEWTDPDRFFGGVELYKAGRAPILVFTGGVLPWLGASTPEGHVLRGYAEAFGVPATAIRVTGNVQNTREEAVAVRQLLGAGRKKILVVTSAFHMKRAVGMFERAGFDVQPFPVDFRAGVASLTPMDFLPSAGAMAGTEFALREFLGRAYYAIVGN